jgi:hypothetical protein
MNTPTTWPTGLLDRIKAAEQRVQDNRAPRVRVDASGWLDFLREFNQTYQREPTAEEAWNARGVPVLDGWSSQRPNANGRWLWREGGSEHREVELVLCASGAEVDEGGDEAPDGSPQSYWMRTPTDQRNMPGLWKRAASGVPLNEPKGPHHGQT